MLSWKLVGAAQSLEKQGMPYEFFDRASPFCFGTASTSNANWAVLCSNTEPFRKTCKLETYSATLLLNFRQHEL